MNCGSTVDLGSARAEVRGGFLQKRYEMLAPLWAFPTRNGKPKERIDDAAGLPSDSPSSPTGISHMDDAVHGHCASSGYQLSRCKR